MKGFYVAYRVIAAVVLLIAAVVQIAHGQKPPRHLRELLRRGCSMTDDHLSRFANGEVVINALKSRDKKEISLCGGVRLDRTTAPTLPELRESLSQKSNRSILAGGPFSDPPTRNDLQSLRLEKNDLEALIECKPEKCRLLVSDRLLQTLGASTNLQHSDLQELYAEDLIHFVGDFRANGIGALGSFEGLSVTAPLAVQNKTLIRRVPLLAQVDPALSLYVEEYPKRVLAGAETKLSWSKINFGLKPIVTITSTTAYAGSDGLPAVVTHQIYASRYMNGSVAVAAVVPDETGRFYLIFTDISRSDALGGLFSGIKRGVASSEGIERVKSLLEAAKTRLEAPPDAQAAGTTPTRTDNENRSAWSAWANTTALIAGVGILVLAVVGLRSYLRRAHSHVGTKQVSASSRCQPQGRRPERPIGQE